MCLVNKRCITRLSQSFESPVALNFTNYRPNNKLVTLGVGKVHPYHQGGVGGRGDGFMVSNLLDNGASSLGLSPGQGHCDAFLDKSQDIFITLTVSLSAEVYKRVPPTLMLGVTL